ncbi:MAG: leucine-rich repeat domain-containing protein, partial [Planctomycetes bacterium]|nr:leucine-rich repeat domain-containing protein [Planctomycetota bacterium]
MSTRTHSRSRIRLLISAALLTAVVLPALTATTVCQAAEFDNSSTTIVNPWIGLTTLGDYRWSNGDDYRLTGTGLLDGATQMHTLTGLETVLGVECHVYSIDVSGTAAANEHYDICVAQDVNGNTRYLKVTGQDASGAVDWTAPSANEAPVLYPAELAVGQRLTWWNGRTLEVVADGVLLPRFDNGMGPYYRCVEVLVTDGSSTRRQWYCRYLGIVKEDCTVATTTTKTAKVPAAKSKLSASRGAKVVRPAAQPAPAPTADPAGWQRAFNIEDVFADYGLLEAALHELQKPVDEVTIEDLRTLADLDPYCFSVPSLEGIQMCDGLVSLFYHGDLLRPLQSAEQLKGLTALECLTLWDSDVSDLSPLAGLVNLRELRLSHNEASDVSPLAGLTAMETLALDGNDIDDISPLGNMAQLRHLYLGNNRLRNVDPLAGCTQLETLSLAYNNIE